MHAPGHFPNATARELYRPVSSFEENILPELDQPPLTCVQTAGDAIFVPDGWSHATINVESRLGFIQKSLAGARTAHATSSHTSRS